jgi:8-oxo-dGTP diphosphatase
VFQSPISTAIHNLHMPDPAILQTYVCGFLFSDSREHVLLIRKRRPTWQAGKLNGVGGKIESFDASPGHAMAREFREEAGLDLAPQNWQEILTLTAPDWHTHFYRAIGDVHAARAMTDEQLEVHDVHALPRETIPNLHWMIPLMLDRDRESGGYRIRVT